MSNALPMTEQIESINFLLDTEGVWLRIGVLEKLGVDSDNTIYPSLKRHRRELTNTWEHKKINNRVWLRFDKLPSLQKDRVTRHYGDLVRVAAESTLKAAALDLVEMMDVKEFLALKIRKDGTGYNTSEASDLAHACGWLRLLEQSLKNRSFAVPLQIATGKTIKGKTQYMSNF